MTKQTKNVFSGAERAQGIKTIFHDEDASIAEAIREELPNTIALLCRWHRGKNNLKVLSKTLGNKCNDALQKLNAAFFGANTEQEFDRLYQQLLYEFPKVIKGD
jgi:transposase-like protein